jgi:hypothetical protein
MEYRSFGISDLADRPSRSICQNFSGSEPSPGALRAIPMMAMGCAVSVSEGMLAFSDRIYFTILYFSLRARQEKVDAASMAMLEDFRCSWACSE